MTFDQDKYKRVHVCMNNASGKGIIRLECVTMANINCANTYMSHTMLPLCGVAVGVNCTSKLCWGKLYE